MDAMDVKEKGLRSLQPTALTFVVFVLPAVKNVEAIAKSFFCEQPIVDSR